MGTLHQVQSGCWNGKSPRRSLMPGWVSPAGWGQQQPAPAGGGASIAEVVDVTGANSVCRKARP